ncbi:alpha/beta hydrolase [Alkaliphilus oremlandii]|uniref:Alpha/beta hydrolase fold n=1 Tax=Alkaliphilus oremlandii (strain OhILAs) TaxID=350688 RepID=A8MFL4_ALKOO|nr:alpha/beta hydrolase [Alkaliphilus oremlandii]ABW17653.1 alpha/beta hydrolase fold [Alkaliphilus oremlandii OhILAs]
MTKKAFAEDFKTTDGKSIYLRKWSPQTPPENPLIIQLVHGMAEHIHRYDEFAKELVKEGFIVYGHDHRGHGRTAKIREDLGYFSDEHGWNRILQDLNEINKKIRIEYPHSKIILFGHSMGSFLSRRYVQLFPHAVDGLVISGTGYRNGILGKVGMIVAKGSGLIFGKKKANPLLNKIAFGSFNNRFKPNETSCDWLTRDKEAVKAYIADPLCGFIFTSEAFYELMKGIEELHEKENLEKTPRDLPLYIFSGTQDPVGNFGKGVLKVCEIYKNMGIKNITYKLYPEGRHEMLNEINRKEVYEDVIHWIRSLY